MLYFVKISFKCMCFNVQVSCAWAHMCECTSTRVMSGVFLNHSPLYLLRQDHSLNLVATDC